MDNIPKLLFLLGLPRSGTTLLMQLLNNHSKMFLTSELQFTPYLVRKHSDYGDLSIQQNFNKMYEDLSGSYYVLKRKAAGKTILSATEWYSRCETYDLTTVLREFIRFEMEGAGENIVLGDKSPNYLYDLQPILAAFPEAKFIHVVRDARESAYSAQNAWKKNIFRYAQRWNDALRVLNDQLDAGSDRILEVKYEDLIREPEQMMRQLSEFIGVDFEESMVALKAPTDAFGAAQGQTRILSTNVEKYKQAFSPRVQEKMESIAHEMLLHYGYPVEYAKKSRRLSSLSMRTFQMLDVFNRLMFDLKDKRGLVTAVKNNVASLKR